MVSTQYRSKIHTGEPCALIQLRVSSRYTCRGPAVNPSLEASRRLPASESPRQVYLDETLSANWVLSANERERFLVGLRRADKPKAHPP